MFTSRRAAKSLYQRRRQSLQLETLEDRALMAVWVGPVGGNWSDAANWNNGDVPNTFGETADFTGTNPGNVNVDGTFDVGSISFTAGGYTLANGGLNINGGGSVTNTAGTNTIGSNLTSTGAINVNANGGLFTLSGANTYSGNTTVNSGGIMRVTTPGALPTNVTVNSGGTFDVNSQNLNTRSFTIAGTGAAGQVGALVNTANTAEASVANVTLTADARIGTTASKLNIFGGTIQGNGNRLTVAGTGETNLRVDNSLQNLSGVTVNSGLLRMESSQNYTGTITVNAGATVDTYAGRTIAAALNLNGGTVASNAGTGIWNGPITLTANSTVNSAGRLDSFGGISGNFTLTKVGGEVFDVRGGVTGLGALNVNAGRVRFEGTGFGAWAGPINLNAGGILSGWTNQTTGVAINLNGGTLAAENNGTNTWNGPITVSANSTLDAGGGNHTFNGPFSGAANLNTTGGNQITVNTSGSIGSISGVGRLAIAGGATLTVGSNNNSSNYFGQLSGAGTLVKSGTGTLTVNSASTISGTMQINAGTLYAAGPGSLGTATVLENGGTLVLAPAATNVSGFGNNGTGWTFNSGATAAADVLTITTAANSLGRSAFFNERVSTSPFSATFTYNNPNTAAAGADGFTFMLHNDPRGVAALGAGGGGLGYTGITPSAAIAINIYGGASGGRGVDILTNGATALPWDTNAMVGNGIPLDITVAYDGTTLSLTIAQGASTYTTTLPVNLATSLGSSAYIGFSGGTGGQNALQTISNFNFQSTGAPSAANATFNNNIAVAAGVVGNTQLRGTASNTSFSVNNLSLAAGSTHNISAAAGTPANVAYTMNFASGTLAGNTTLNIANNGTGLGIANFNGAITGGGSLTKGGAGQLALRAASSYSGGTTIAAGRAIIYNAAGFGTGTVNVGAGTYAMLWFNTGSNTVTNDWVLNGIGGSQNGEQKDAIYGDGGGAGFRDYVLSGTITLNSTSNIGGNNANNITVTGQITGAGGLTKGGTRGDENNTLIITNPANNYQGPTTIVQGRLQTGANEVIPHGANAGGVVINAGRVLELGIYTETINSLSGSGDVLRSGSVQGITTFTTDPASGVSTSKTYTHKLDFAGNGTPAVVNGVAFTDAGTTGPTWAINAPNVLTGAPNFSGDAGLDPAGMRELFSDFYYAGNALTLTGLTPGKTYELRLYNRVWGGPRFQYATFDDDGAGPNSTSVLFDQDGNATPNYLSYRYTATTSTLNVSFQAIVGGNTYHFYGLTNEEVTGATTPSLIVGDGSNTTYDGVVHGAGNLVKQGSGTLTLTKSQAYTGDTNVAMGTLKTGGDEIIPHGPSAGDLIVNGTLDLGMYQETVNALSGSGNVVRNASGGILAPVYFNTDVASGISTGKTYTHLLDFIADGSAAVVNGVPFTAAGQSGVNWNLTPGGLPSIPENGGPGTLPTQLDDNGLEKLYRDFYYNGNPATLTLSGLTAGQTYEVRLYNRQWGVSNRTQLFTFDADGAGPMSDQVSFDEDASVTPNYLAYRFTAVSDGVGGALPLTVSTLQTGAGTYHWYGVSNEVVSVPTFTIGDNGDSIFSGSISGNGQVVKQGTGAQTLSGNNTYSGATTINAGTLLVNGSLAGGPVNVQSGATLAGTGSMAGNVNVVSGGTINPGTPSDATDDLSIGGNLTLAAGAIFVADIVSATNHDQIVLTGATSVATVAGATLDLNITGSQAPGGRYVLVNNTANANAVVGTFAGYPAQLRFTDPANPTEYFVISYAYNAPGSVSANNDIALLRNGSPVAVDDTFTAPRNQTYTNNVLDNDFGGTDTDPDGDTLSVLPGSFSTANGGTVDLAADGTFIYTPPTDFIGADTFDYTVTDGELSAIGTVTINVSAIYVDPLDPSRLIVAGSSGGDRIIISAGVQIRLNNALSPAFSGISTVVVYGNEGDDTITVSNYAGPVELHGGDGNDYLAGGAGDDILNGGAGTDRLLGGDGSDYIYGGGGNDTASGGNGADYIYGDDYLDQDGFVQTADDQGKDNLSGDNGHDFIYGQGGNDTLYGGNGNDYLRGGDDNDDIDGGIGNDTLVGDAGSDKLYGRDGSDVLIGGDGFDTLLGSTGADLIFANILADDSDDTIWEITDLWYANQYQQATDMLASLSDDDGIADAINGEADADWYVVFASDNFLNAIEKKAPNQVVKLT